MNTEMIKKIKKALLENGYGVTDTPKGSTANITSGTARFVIIEFQDKYDYIYLNCHRFMKKHPFASDSACSELCKRFEEIINDEPITNNRSPKINFSTLESPAAFKLFSDGIKWIADQVKLSQPL